MDATYDNLRRLEATVPMENERAAAYRTLLAQYVSKMDYLQFYNNASIKPRMAGQKSKLRQDKAALAEAETELPGTHRGISAGVSKLSCRPWMKAASLIQEMRKAEQKPNFSS